jgi:hypothetical protein
MKRLIAVALGVFVGGAAAPASSTTAPLDVDAAGLPAVEYGDAAFGEQGYGRRRDLPRRRNRCNRSRRRAVGRGSCVPWGESGSSSAVALHPIGTRYGGSDKAAGRASRVNHRL